MTERTNEAAGSTTPRVDALERMILDRAADEWSAEWCGHFSSDINGNCMRCANEAERRADMARAWNEAHRQVCPSGLREANGGKCDLGLQNPYRAASPAHPNPEPPTGDGGREGVGRRG